MREQLTKPIVVLLTIFNILLFGPKSYSQNAQGSTVSFQKELSSKSKFITAMVADSDGYLWLGTGKGLYRYNGSSYKVFFHGDKGSIASDYILSLFIDVDGTIWTGTDVGVHHIDNNTVTNYYIGIGPVSAIDKLDDSHLLVAGLDGLYTFDVQAGTASLFVMNDDYANSRIIRTGESHIWVLSSLNSNKVSIIDKVNKEERILSIPPSSKVNNIITFMGKVYVSLSTGIKCFTQSGDELALPASLEPYSSSPSLYCNVDSYKNALNFYLKDVGAIRYSPKDETTSPIDGIPALTCANLNAVSLENNVCYLKNFSDLEFSHNMKSLFLAVEGIEYPEIIHDVYSSTASRNITFTTPKGVYLFDIVSGFCRNVTPKIPTVGNYLIINSFMDDSGYFWLTLSGGTLLKYKPTVIDGHPDLELVKSFEIGSSDIHLWQTSSGSHEVNFVYGKSIFTITDNNEIIETKSSLNLSPFPCKSTDGKVYLYGKDGIFVQNQDKSFTQLSVDLMPNSMCSDYKGDLWIGTDEDGLYHYIVNTGVIYHFSKSDGLPENSVRDILSYKNQIWVAFRSNVSKIDVDSGNNSTLLDNDLSSYAINYGLLSGTSSFIPMLGDRIIFGNGRGFTCIDPLENQIERQIPVTIEAVMSDGELLSPDENGVITLDYKHKNLVFYFSGVDYDFGQMLNYSYQLSGYDKSWMFSMSNNSATYSSVPAGNYTFKARVQLPNGHWNETEASMRIRIKPHPLLSAPMKALYTLIALGLILLAVLWVERVRRKKEKEELKAVESRMNIQLDKEKVDFFTNISHEYRTPLTLIYGPAKELSESDLLDANGKKLVSLIKNNASKMLDLTEEILDFDKISSGTIDKLKVKATDISALVESTANNFGFLFEQKNISYSCDIDKIDNVYCDPTKIVKILTNLISNAIKYTPAGGTVLIGLRKLDFDEALKFGFGSLDRGQQYVAIGVSDTGVGIPKDKIKKIFEKYERLKNNGAVSASGFGVGLNYALHLAEIHKGSIAVVPNTPTGSIFSFVFPCGKESYSEKELLTTSVNSSNEYAKLIEESVSEKTIPESAKDYKVLVVEDNDELRNFFKEVLSKNFTVECVPDGEKALEFLKNSKVNLVLSDLMMPNIDGFALCQMIKEDPETSNIPVVLLTAATEDSTKAEGFSKKADAFLTKPFDPDVLRMQIYSLIENRKYVQTSSEMSPAPKEDPLDKLPAKDRAFVEKMMSLMEANLANDSYSAASMAEDMGFSYSKFFYKSKDLLGIAPSEWISSYRLEKAKELLKQGDHNVSEVAYMTGFASIQSFSRSFKNKFGVSPSSL